MPADAGPPRPSGREGGQPRRGRRQERRIRRRRIRWALAASLSVAAASSVGFAWFGGSTATIGATRNARAVNQRTLDAATIAAQNDAAIVDVVATLGYQGGQAAGTGVVLTSNGEILTNNHVISGATSITVKISNGSKTYKANVVGTDTVGDVAVLQASGASGLATATIGNSSNVTVGQSVVAIGNAFNRAGAPTVTQGSITDVRRSITVVGDSGTAEQLSNLLETDAQLQPGNSGGPLFNTQGQVVGINTAASAGAAYATSARDGYAIPINDALTIVHQIESGKTSGNVHVGATAILGVQARSAAASSDAGGTQSGSGVPVVGVEPGTPAARAGIAAGDQIRAVDGTTVASVADLTRILGSKRPGDTVGITWLDPAGQLRHATVRLTVGPAA